MKMRIYNALALTPTSAARLSIKSEPMARLQFCRPDRVANRRACQVLLQEKVEMNRRIGFERDVDQHAGERLAANWPPRDCALRTADSAARPQAQRGAQWPELPPTRNRPMRQR
jgi:hypothetical protein